MRVNVRIAGAGFSLALVVVGVFAAVVGSGYGFIDEDGRVDAGFLPVVFGVVLAVLAAVDLVQRLLRLRPTGTLEDVVEEAAGADEIHPDDQPLFNEHGEEVDIFGRTQPQRTRILVFVILGVAATILLTALLGFIIACTLLVFGVAVGLERRKLLPSAVIALCTGAVVWLVFVQLLSVPLPTGLIGLI